MLKRRLKIFLCLFFLFFLAENQLKAQDDIKPIIDSIDNLINDTNKVIAYNDLIWKICNYDSLNSANLAQKSIALATELNYTKGIATAQKNLAAYYYYKAYYPEALDLYEKSLSNYEIAKDKKGIAISYRNIGNIHYQIGNSNVAIQFYFKSLKIREEIKDTIGMGNTYSAIGGVYQNIDDYHDSSLVYFKRALDIFLTANDYYNVASTYLNISIAYHNFFNDINFLTKKKDSTNLDSSIYYSKKCIKISEEIQVLRFAASAYEVSGMCFIELNEMDSAYFYLNKSGSFMKNCW